MGQNKEGPALKAITDTACCRSVAGADWMELYINAAEKVGERPKILNNDEHFRFGASRIFHSTYSLVVSFEVGGVPVELKVAIVNGELLLLVNRPVLAKLDGDECGR